MRNLLFTLIFLEGATVMIVELLAARMIAPAYGTSLPVWTMVLALAVGALAAGYRVGGKRAAKSGIDSLLVLFLIASSVIAVMPLLAEAMIGILYGTSFWISLLFCAVVFIMPPLFMLGASTPIITRLLSAEVTQEGSVAGKVFGISTLGGIAGTFLTGFILIPSFGLTNTALGAALFLGTIPAVWLARKRHLSHAISFWIVMLIVLLLTVTGKGSRGDVKVLYHSEGLLGQLIVADIPKDIDTAKGYERVMFVNRTGQTWIDRTTGKSRWGYVEYLSSVAGTVKKKKPHVLLLGLGGGTVARELQQRYDADVDAIELDERIAMVAKNFFSLGDDVNVIIDDARHFLRTTEKKYDLVIFDVFGGEVPPAHALTLETFSSLKDMLQQDGIVIINFNGFIDGDHGKGGRSIFKTLQAAGFEVKALATPGEEVSRNMLYIGSHKALVLDDPGMNNALLDEKQLDIKDALVLKDNKPVLELLNLPASLAWRKGYREYAKALNSKGVKVFE